MKQKWKYFQKLLFAFIFICITGTASVLAAEAFELHLLDVGQGQSILIEADGHYMLIDGGGREKSSFVVSYLRQEGINTLDYTIVSHYDEDHMAGVIGVLSVFGTDVFLAPGYKGEGDLYESLAAAAFSNGCIIMHAKSGDRFSMGKASIEIIGPVGVYDLDNDKALAVKITYGDTSFLVCGDAEQQSEIDMARSSLSLDADVYVVDHHGSSTSSMDIFLDAVSPSYAMISCGADNSYGHPSMETLQRLQNHGCAMFRTDKQGTIVAYSDGNDIWFNMNSCDDWTAGNGIFTLDDSIAIEEDDISRMLPPGDELLEGNEEPSYSYVCNTNTKKLHYPDCKSVNQMKEEHRLFTSMDRENLIAQGYKPCGNCNP